MQNLKRLLRTTLLLRCPHCGEGKLFESMYRVRPTCPVCGVRFERNPGEWTGAVVIVYAIAVGICFPLWIWMFATGHTFRYDEWALAGLALFLIAATYRNAKAMWTWIIHAAGQVYRD